MRKQKAFTLIELLVVIAIIALLASIVLVALNGARVKARDAKRVADLRQIETALELYASDNGGYPAVACGTDGTGGCWSTFMPTQYIAAMPTDSTSGHYYFFAEGWKPTSSCAYTYTNSTSDYMLAASLENPSAIPNSCPGGFNGWDISNNSLNYLVGQ